MSKDKDIEKRLKEFHNKLSPDFQTEFRKILDDFASYYFEIGEIFKQTCIDLIPSKIATVYNNFKPDVKPTGLLAELRHNIDMMSTQERLNLITKLQSKSDEK